MHILGAHPGQQLLMAPLPFDQRHLQGQLDAFGRAVGVIRIDQNGFFELLGRAGEARQHQHPRIGWVLRGNELLGHQVHAVAQRRDQRHIGHPV